MSIYDIVMLAIFIGSILFGAWKGLAWQVASLAAIIVSYLVAINFSQPLSTYLQAEPPWNKFGAMLILFVGTSLIIWFVFGRIRGTIKKMHLSGFDRQAGALLGAVKGAVLCMVVTMFAVTLLGDKTAEAICDSRSGGYITRGINELTAVVPSELNDVLNPYISRFNDALEKEHLEHQHERAPFSNQFEFGQASGDQPIYGGQQNNGQQSVAQPQPNYGNNQTYGRLNPIQDPNRNQNYQTYNGQWQQPSGTTNQYSNQYQNQNRSQAPNPSPYPGNQGNWNLQQPNYTNQANRQSGYPATGQTNQQGGGWPSIQVDSKELINAGAEVIKDTAKRLLDSSQNR